MKTRLAILALSFALASCDSVPRAVPLQYANPRPYAARWIARWGGEKVIVTDTAAQYRNVFTYTYPEFFKMCGGRHPNELGIKVIGKLPDGITPATPAGAVATPTAQPEAAPAPAPAPAAVYQPTYSKPQSCR